MRTATALGDERETLAMLAVALVALAATAAIILSVANVCRPARTVLLETLPSGSGVTGTIDEIHASDGSADRTVVAPVTIRRSDVLQLRGYARRSGDDAALAGVFAVVDGGAPIRATVDGDRFTVVVEPGPKLGVHAVRMLAVPADLSAAVPFGVPVDFIVR